MKTVAVSIGCPAGIGPEVSVAAAHAVAATMRVVLVGDPEVIRRAASIVAIDAKHLEPLRSTEDIAKMAPGKIGIWMRATKSGAPCFGTPTAKAGRAQLAWVDQALNLVTEGAAHALTTGPVSKHAIAVGGAPAFRGHTEYIAERTGAKNVFMAFWHQRFTTALVTTHLPLRQVARAVTRSGVRASILALAHFLTQTRPAKPKPGKPIRILVLGLNPHAGEQGLLGMEELRTIAPAARSAQRVLDKLGSSIAIEGPMGAETAVRQARDGYAHGLVAIYHDQATIPMKLLTFGEAVNVTLGLPVVRTSVDHGTGYDIAGTGTANPSGMIHALRLGARLTQKPR